MTKQCIFCGERVNSKEHVWPAWLLKLVDKSPKGKMPVASQRLHQDGSISEWSAVNATLRTKNVCRTCNSGWMSRLEDEAKPILSPMILGNSITLSASQRRIVSAWITKCAMLFDSMDQGEVFFNGLDRFHFQLNQTPFDSTNVWLGKYDGAARGAFTNHRTLRGKSRAGWPHKIHVMTMVFNYLVIQILSDKLLELHDQAFKIDMEYYGSWDQHTVQIWPVGDFNDVPWPPSFSLDDTLHTPKALAIRFGGPKTVFDRPKAVR